MMMMMVILSVAVVELIELICAASVLQDAEYSALQCGIYCIEGDLFEVGSDIEDPSQWKAFSQMPQLQPASRYNVVSQYSVKFILPGHGPMFQLTENHLTLLQNATSPTSA